MKQIKFCQYNKKLGKWHHWGYISEGEFVGPMNNQDGDWSESQQFIGCTDKNEENIYEKDVIQCEGLRGQVIYKDEYGAFYLRVIKVNRNEFLVPPEIGSDLILAELKLSDWEVIGNICENPELIK